MIARVAVRFRFLCRLFVTADVGLAQDFPEVLISPERYHGAFRERGCGFGVRSEDLPMCIDYFLLSLLISSFLFLI